MHENTWNDIKSHTGSHSVHWPHFWVSQKFATLQSLQLIRDDRDEREITVSFQAVVRISTLLHWPDLLWGLPGQREGM